MVIAAAGPIDHAELTRLAGELFSGFKTGSQCRDQPKPTFCGTELLYNSDDTAGTAHFAVGFEGLPWTHPDSITLMVLQTIIGSYKRGEGLVPPKLSGNKIARTL